MKTFFVFKLWAGLTLFPLATPASQLATNLYPSHQRRDAGPSNSSHSALVHDTGSGNITFAVTAVRDVGDLYFHLEAPATNSWVAVGTGSEMQGSLMWIVYKSGDGEGVTFSPRTVNSHSEPSYSDQTGCELDKRDGLTNAVIPQDGRDMYVINGYCKNVNNIALRMRRNRQKRVKESEGNGLLAFNSTQQGFMFAFGPAERTLHDDDLNAGIRRHTLYGTFSMDLSKATVESTTDMATLGAVGMLRNQNAEVTVALKKDRDVSGPIHTVMMCGTFIILFPIGVVFLRLLEKVRWHAWTQGAGMVIAIGGVGAGVRLGLEYNHSKKATSAHQILGLIIVAITILQFTFGAIHHRLYKKNQLPTILGRIHLYLGPFILLMGAINGFLGFNFAGASQHNTFYGPIVAVVFAGLVGTLFWVRRRKRAGSGLGAKMGNDGMGTRGVIDGVELRENPRGNWTAHDFEGRAAQPRALV